MGHCRDRSAAAHLGSSRRTNLVYYNRTSLVDATENSLARESNYDRKDHADDEAGFTLIELLVVLVILGLLAAVAGPRVVGYLGSARSDTAGIQISALAQALDLYQLDVGRYPSNDEGLGALLSAPSGSSRWNGPYISGREVPPDPWGNTYVYRIPGTSGAFDLYTLGADNRPGGSGENASVGRGAP